jgi:hypothetical protein
MTLADATVQHTEGWVLQAMWMLPGVYSSRPGSPMLGHALSFLKSSNEIALLKPGGAQLVLRPVQTPHHFVVIAVVQVTTGENEQLLREC